MKRFIIMGAILASAALFVLFAHEGAFSQRRSAVMKIKIQTRDGAHDVKDEDDRPGARRIMEEEVKAMPGVEEIGKVYKYTRNPNCTVYCSGGWCDEFCW